MSDTQLPKALKLAEKVVSTWAHKPPEWAVQTAAELRRLHAELEQARAALAAQGEPVAWMVMNGICKYQLFAAKAPADALCAEMQKRHDLSGSFAAFHVQPLYTAPPAPAKPMTDEEIVAALKACDREDPSKEGWIWRTRIKWARAIEAHHGITADSGEVQS